MNGFRKCISKVVFAALVTAQLASVMEAPLVYAEEVEEIMEEVEEDEEAEEEDNEDEANEKEEVEEQEKKESAEEQNQDENSSENNETKEDSQDIQENAQYENLTENDVQESILDEQNNEELNVGLMSINEVAEMPVEEMQEEEVVETTKAAFYVIKRGGSRKNLQASNYISLGKGEITNPEKIYDDYDAIKEHLYDIPSLDKLDLADNEEVRWYSIKKETDGWHVDGEIIETEESSEQGEIETPIESEEPEEVVETTKAAFYVVKKGGSRTNYAASNYISLGKGEITDPQKIYEDYDVIKEHLYIVPSTEKLNLTENEEIRWYSIKKEADGWHVDGEILDVTPNQPVVSYEALDECDMMDFSNWRSGCYHWDTGKYISYASRICLNDYKKVNPGSSYYVVCSDTDYHILVREMSESGKMLVSHNLKDGDKLEIGDNTEYVGVGIYNVKGTTVSMEKYSQMFSNGFMAVLSSKPVILLPKPNPELPYEDLDECDMTSLANWKSGLYDTAVDSFKEDASYISLNDYKTVIAGTTYKAYLSAKSYQFVVNTYNKASEFVNSYTLADGETFTPTEEEDFVAVSVHRTDVTMTYSDYESYFNTGYSAILTSKDGISILRQPASVYEELELMLATGDMTEHDISAYKCTAYEFFNKIIPKMMEEHALEFASAYNVYPNGTAKGLYMNTCKIENMDADFVGRFQRTKKSVDEYLSMVDSKMTDLDKVVLAHEFIVQKTNYVSNKTIAHCVGGALGDGAAVCQGYTEAMTLLMGYVGVEVDEAISTNMNHSWSYVKVDGNWYHLDSTWDDTQRGTDEVNAHKFLIRNSEEFKTIKGTSRAHYDWYYRYNTKEESTSTAFSEWFVHDIAGFMYYHDGLWYYRDKNTNSINCSDIYGNNMQVVIDGTGQVDKIQITGIQGNVMHYKIGSAQYTKEL